MKSSSEPKQKKPIKVLFSFLETLLIAGLVVVAIMSFGTRIPLLARMGLNFFAVTSGSMEPKIETGSLIYVGKYKLEDLKVGDIITYKKVNPDSKQATVITHRISNVTKEEEKQNDKTVLTYTFKTKGDANSTEDTYTINPTEIIGMYKGHVAKLGYVSTFAQTPQGFILLVIVPAVILILWEIASLIAYFKSHYENKSKAEIARLKAELEHNTMKHAE